MTDNELLTRIIVMIDGADAAQDLIDEDEDGADSTSVDIDYDTYQDIHKLLRLNGRLKDK